MHRLLQHAWWAVTPFLVAIILGWLRGYPLAWLAYTAFNVLGVWLYLGPKRSPRLQTAMKVLAIFMVPVGVFGVLASGGSGKTQGEAGSPGSTDEVSPAVPPFSV